MLNTHTTQTLIVQHQKYKGTSITAPFLYAAVNKAASPFSAVNARQQYPSLRTTFQSHSTDVNYAIDK